jgi:RNA-directed DNA polymerase
MYGTSMRENRESPCLPAWLITRRAAAVPGNNDAVNAFRHQTTRHWHQALRRRSQKTRLTWDRMDRIATRWLPQTRILHPFPEARFAATHPR